MMPADPAAHALLDDAYGDDAERALRAANELRLLLADRLIAAAVATDDAERRMSPCAEAVIARAKVLEEIRAADQRFSGPVGRTHIGRMVRRATEGEG